MKNTIIDYAPKLVHSLKLRMCVDKLFISRRKTSPNVKGGGILVNYQRRYDKLNVINIPNAHYVISSALKTVLKLSLRAVHYLNKKTQTNILSRLCMYN